MCSYNHLFDDSAYLPGVFLHIQLLSQNIPFPKEANNRTLYDDRYLLIRPMQLEYGISCAISLFEIYRDAWKEAFS